MTQQTAMSSEAKPFALSGTAWTSIVAGAQVAVPPGAGAQVHTVVRAETSRLRNIVPAAGFRVAGIIAGSHEDIRFNEPEPSFVDILTAKDLTVPRGQYLVVILQNVGKVAAIASATLFLEDTGAVGEAPTIFVKPDGSGGADAERVASEAVPKGVGVAVAGSGSSASAMYLDKMPTRAVPELLSEVELGEGVRVLIGRHQAKVVAEWLEKPGYVIPSGILSAVAMQFNLAHHRKVPAIVPANGVEVIATLPSGVVERIAVALTRRANLFLHETHRREAAAWLRGALMPTVVPSPQSPVSSELVRPPEHVEEATKLREAAETAHSAPPIHCDACDTALPDGRRFLVLDVGHGIAGVEYPTGTRSVHFLLCEGCATEESVARTMVDVAKSVKDFLEGKAQVES